MKTSIKKKNPLETFRTIEEPFFKKGHLFGTGLAISCLVKAIKRNKIPLNDFVIVYSGGNSDLIMKHLKIDAFHTTSGRAIPFAIGMKLASPKLRVIVFGNNKDLLSIGGSHFINAARRNIDMMVICLNNTVYSILEDIPESISSEKQNPRSKFNNHFENDFNLPNLTEMAGGTYIARWTALHIEQIKSSFYDASKKSGFSLIEILAPFPSIFDDRNKFENGLEELKLCFDKSKIQNEVSTKEADIGMKDKFVVGMFIDKERPSFLDAMNIHFKDRFGDKYVTYNG
jgi:2-oxoglutarate ferredoxin oxidoreductase subunit beta